MTKIAAKTITGRRGSFPSYGLSGRASHQPAAAPPMRSLGPIVHAPTQNAGNSGLEWMDTGRDHRCIDDDVERDNRRHNPNAGRDLSQELIELPNSSGWVGFLSR
jgi:hypothetical protein